MLPSSRGAMKARWRAAVSASCCADGWTKRLNIIPYRREQAHVPDRTPDFADALPFFCGAIVSDAA